MDYTNSKQHAFRIRNYHVHCKSLNKKGRKALFSLFTFKQCKYSMNNINSKTGKVKKSVEPAVARRVMDSRGLFPTAFAPVSRMSLASLQTHGYVVVPGLLSKETIDRLIADYHNDLATGPKELYNQGGVITGTKSHGLDDILNPLMARIQEDTDVKVDFCYPSIDYFNNNDVSYTWHQDPDQYLLWQNSYDSLNIWIPLIKPEGDKDSLGVVPADRVSKYWRILRGQGATWFTDGANGTTSMFSECSGQHTVLDLSVNAIGEVPVLYPGDALVMRSDTIHRTQIKTHTRLAASIKCTNTRGWIDRSTVDGWIDCDWTNSIKSAMNQINVDDSVLHSKLYRRIAQEFATKDRVKIKDIVLTKK
jgi:hypothetical protein